jgi:methylenetetrahydrofolate dehydrogenase (NADP+)/methenyltetrahydrofolate cyclohydrolase
MLLNEKATVTVANSNTIDLKKITRDSDIVISAVGKPNLIKAEMIKKGAVVIDIGTTVRNGKIYGDVDFDKVSLRASYITPNPGGIGPMTVAILLNNLLKASNLQRRSDG